MIVRNGASLCGGSLSHSTRCCGHTRRRGCCLDALLVQLPIWSLCETGCGVNGFCSDSDGLRKPGSLLVKQSLLRSFDKLFGLQVSYLIQSCTHSSQLGMVLLTKTFLLCYVSLSYRLSNMHLQRLGESMSGFPLDMLTPSSSLPILLEKEPGWGMRPGSRGRGLLSVCLQRGSWPLAARNS